MVTRSCLVVPMVGLLLALSLCSGAFAQEQSILRTKQPAADTSGGNGTMTPGEYPFSPEQDKAFYETLHKAQQLGGAPKSLFLQSLQSTASERIAILDELSKQNAWLALPDFWRTPTLRERFEREYNLAQARTIPGIRTNSGGGGVTASFSYQQLLQEIGILPDQLPKITYTVEETSLVDVSLYSIQAMMVASIFKGVQVPGTYTMWCLLDRKGNAVPRGYYAAEARIGESKKVQKGIAID